MNDVRVTGTQSTLEGGIGVPPHQGSTIVSALIANGTRRPDTPAMRYRDHTGKWQVINWKDYELAARQVAAGLAELGLGAGSRVGILASNRPEWHMADLGILTNRGITVPLYPTSSPAQVSYALRHSGASVCFVDTHEQLGKVMLVRDELPDLQRIVLIDTPRRAGDTFVMNFDELRATGVDYLRRGSLERLPTSEQVQPDDVATIVYTSGTTGPPKGAMITHQNVMWTLRQVAPEYGIGEGERFLSFLPLSHIAERMMSDFAPIAVVGETWFARSLATVPEDLPDCRPTVFLAVPRVWQKLRAAIEGRVETQPVALKSAVATYLGLGHRIVEANQGGAAVPVPLVLTYRALDRVIGASIRRHVGLDQARVLVSSAAPIHPDLIRWFHAMGLPLLQIYGQTESCGPTTANRLASNHIGTVGTGLPGMTVVLAPDGEVLLKGENVCRGYLDDPEGTRSLIDDEGWMHSGDIGVLDANGDLRITGRKKDLIITASGKNVAPQEIENELCNDPLISDAVVVGEGRKYLSVLLALDAEEAAKWARAHDLNADPRALAENAILIAHVEHVVEEVNSRRSHAEWVKKFRILPGGLTTAAEELTPTMKVKRAVVYKHYQSVIDELYAGE